MTKKFRSVDERVETCSTDNQSVSCTKLPEFWRANKKFSTPFTVYFADLSIAPEGTDVFITAANHKNQNPELRNNQTKIINGIARFNDLRFIGKSGRDTKFDVFIHLQTEPKQVFTYKNAIKVTVDGPRPPRPKNEKPLSCSSPIKRKLSDFSSFDELEKRIRTEGFTNFPIHLLTSMPPSCSMPNSPESFESSTSPSHQMYLPPSPQSIVSSQSETRTPSTSPSSWSPSMLPARKRFSACYNSAFMKPNEDDQEQDLSDLIDTSKFRQMIPAHLENHVAREQVHSPDPSHHLLVQNMLRNGNQSRMDIQSMLSVIPPEGQLYFLYLLNYYCNNGQELLGAPQIAAPQPQYPYATH